MARRRRPRRGQGPQRRRKALLDHSVAEIRATDPEVIARCPTSRRSREPTSRPSIVIGYGQTHGRPRGRSDTVMLVRVDPGEKATLLSFPRDLLVSHPGCEGYPPWTGRINEATRTAAARDAETVKELAGIPINYMVTVNFRAFRRIVDTSTASNGRRPGDTSTTTQAGDVRGPRPEARLPAPRRRGALDFVRYRHTDSDLYRVAPAGVREGVKQRVSNAWDIFELPGIVQAVTENIEVAKGGGSRSARAEGQSATHRRSMGSRRQLQAVPLEAS